jgi:hypothetical protein
MGVLTFFGRKKELGIATRRRRQQPTRTTVATVDHGAWSWGARTRRVQA